MIYRSCLQYKLKILEDFERESAVHNFFKILVKWSLLYNITSSLIEGSLYSAEASISVSEDFKLIICEFNNGDALWGVRRKTLCICADFIELSKDVFVIVTLLLGLTINIVFTLHLVKANVHNLWYAHNMLVHFGLQGLFVS